MLMTSVPPFTHPFSRLLEGLLQGIPSRAVVTISRLSCSRVFMHSLRNDHIYFLKPAPVLPFHCASSVVPVRHLARSKAFSMWFWGPVCGSPLLPGQSSVVLSRSLSDSPAVCPDCNGWFGSAVGSLCRISYWWYPRWGLSVFTCVNEVFWDEPPLVCCFEESLYHIWFRQVESQKQICKTAKRSQISQSFPISSNLDEKLTSRNNKEKWAFRIKNNNTLLLSHSL